MVNYLALRYISQRIKSNLRRFSGFQYNSNLDINHIMPNDLTIGLIILSLAETSLERIIL
jgi:hypothetical protein